MTVMNWKGWEDLEQKITKINENRWAEIKAVRHFKVEAV